jgi:hypothetical protein
MKEQLMHPSWGSSSATLAVRVGGAIVGAALAAACARGIDDPLDLEVGGAAGQGGTLVGGVAGSGIGGSPGASGGAGPSVGSGGAEPVGTGGSNVSSGGAGPVGAGGSGGAGSSTGGASGADVDASTGGRAGAGGQGGSATADASDVFDAGSPPKDAPPDVPCPGAGTALSFNRTASQYVLIPAAALPTGNSARTIEMWVLNKSPIANWAPDHTLWEHGGTTALTVFAMDFDNVAGPRQMELYVNPAANSYFFDSGMGQDTWFHVAGTYDGANKTHAFINGVEIGTGFTVSGPLATPTNMPLYVGSGTLRSYFTGSIDEVRIWNVARTATQIAQDMHFRLVGNEPGLVGYYRFDEGSGTTARDATSRGNNGTLTNGPTYGASGVALGCR